MLEKLQYGTSQKIKEYSIEKYGQDMYIYSDTDSIKTLLPLEDLKKLCNIDDVELRSLERRRTRSAWKVCKAKNIY